MTPGEDYLSLRTQALKYTSKVSLPVGSAVTSTPEK